MKKLLAAVLVACCALPARAGGREAPAGGLGPELRLPAFSSRRFPGRHPEVARWGGGEPMKLTGDGKWGKKEWTIFGVVVAVAAVAVAVIANNSDGSGGGGGGGGGYY